MREPHRKYQAKVRFSPCDICPGLELDKLIALEIFGQRPGRAGYLGYSTMIGVAWMLVDELARRGFDMDVGVYGSTHEYQASIQREGFGPYYILGKTAPHAICLAAIKSLEATPGKEDDHGRH